MPDIFSTSQPLGDIEVPRSEAGRRMELNPQAKRRRERDQRRRQRSEDDEGGLEVDTFEPIASPAEEE